MAYNIQSYLGKAVSYPLRVEGGRLSVSTGKEVVENAIIMILMTPKGSRFFLPEYGSDLYKRRYEPNDEVLARLLRHDIIDAISTWEKRVKPLKVEVIMGVDVCLCKIVYRILKSNEVDSFVFPFYRNKRVIL